MIMVMIMKKIMIMTLIMGMRMVMKMIMRAFPKCSAPFRLRQTLRAKNTDK